MGLAPVSSALAGDWEYGILPPSEAFPLVKAAANEAPALNDHLGEAHTSLAFVLDLYYWDWDAVEKQYQLAINLNPNYAIAHQWYAWHLLVLGHNAAGMFEMRRASVRGGYRRISTGNRTLRASGRFRRQSCVRVRGLRTKGGSADNGQGHGGSTGSEPLGQCQYCTDLCRAR
jgi:hypothetical protein